MDEKRTAALVEKFKPLVLKIVDDAVNKRLKKQRYSKVGRARRYGAVHGPALDINDQRLAELLGPIEEKLQAKMRAELSAEVRRQIELERLQGIHSKEDFSVRLQRAIEARHRDVRSDNPAADEARDECLAAAARGKKPDFATVYKKCRERRGLK